MQDAKRFPVEIEKNSAVEEKRSRNLQIFAFDICPRNPILIAMKRRVKYRHMPIMLYDIRCSFFKLNSFRKAGGAEMTELDA